MTKIKSVLYIAIQKLSEPKNIRMMMFLLPVILSVGFGEYSMSDVGGNPGGCTAG